MRADRLALVLAPASLAAATLFAGCGSSSPGLSAQASQELQAQVQAVTAAARSQDPAGAVAALLRLRSEVAQLRAAGQISASRSASILTAAATVESQLGSIPTTTTSTTTTTTTVAPQPAPRPGPPPAPPDHKGHGGHDH